ncbi:MAG TPA: Maf family protein [Thermoanaerobaculia bacterium]|nr:Maf family protein [Thermoanaerobaculia bacterium]
MPDTLLVLASESPRRAEILTGLGIPFTVDPPNVEEKVGVGETAQRAASRLAAEKAAQVAARHPQSWVLAADTLVFLAGEILGKPADAADAARMLRQLSGQEHQVVTALRLRRGADPGRELLEQSRVRIAPMDDEEVDWYVATREPVDKAGAYAVQGLGARFIESVSGSFTNVMGLPARGVYRLLREAPDPALARLALASP